MAQTKAGRKVGKRQHSFAQIPQANIPRSAINRSCDLKTTFSGGDLVPIFVDEILPGDTIKMSVSHFARLATPLHPIMDGLYVDLHFFAVPNRLLWDNWERFMGAQDNPGDSTSFEVPQVAAPAATGWQEESLGDYLGLPTKIPDQEVSALFFRAVNMIWNEWFRDQNLQDSLPEHKNDGPDPASDYAVPKRGKRHDYITSSLPWPQKGPAVQLPLGTTAPIVGEARVRSESTAPAFFPAGGGGNGPFNIEQNQGTNWEVHWSGTSNQGAQDMRWYEPNLYADMASGRVSGGDPPYVDLSSATAATVNALRSSIQIQRLYERDARGGTRYPEMIHAHFGVTNPDSRMQRPEYLGGASSPMSVNPVPQTSATDVTTSPQGNLAAFVTTANNGRAFVKSFTEHCVLIGFASVRAELTYQQNLPRMFSRRDRWEFYWPALSRIGEQEVLNQEVYSDGTAADTEAWGYQERFAEYRYKPSTVTGKMRSNAAQSLDTWHLALDFGSTRPSLNGTFIEEQPPIDRVIAVTSEPQVLFNAYFQYDCIRPMPVYSVPGMMDHF